MEAQEADPMRGAIAGLAESLAVSMTMDLFRNAVSALCSDAGSGGGEHATRRLVRGAL